MFLSYVYHFLFLKKALLNTTQHFFWSNFSVSSTTAPAHCRKSAGQKSLMSDYKQQSVLLRLMVVLLQLKGK